MRRARDRRVGPEPTFPPSSTRNTANPLGGLNRAQVQLPDPRGTTLIGAPPDSRAMAKDGDAVVTPDQPWTQDGTADVTPLPFFPEQTARTLPLDNRSPGTHTVRRADFPGGLVIVPTGHEPAAGPATLPIRSSDGDEVVVTGDNYTEWPDGFVIWFLTQ